MRSWKNLIEPLFLRLIASRSDTNTIFETFIEEIILTWLKSRPYFKANPDNLGTRGLFNDPHERELVWAFVRGSSKKTIVLINHHDVVDTEDYGKLKQYALRPDELKAALKKKGVSKHVQKDLDSDDWLFARGAADMKAGVAIHLALLDRFSELENFKGSLLFLSVPDEESLSKGMLSAVELMQELRREHDLEYVLTMNAEPYFNNVKNKAIMYEGSVGKIMPIVYVRGVKSHIGDPFNGINPSLILANIQRHTELNISLCDVFGEDATPPPVWVNLKDRKKAYDASIPEAATGYFNWLTFTKTPVDILAEMRRISHLALADTLQHLEKSYIGFCALNNEEPDDLDLVPSVIDFKELYAEAVKKNGLDFTEGYDAFLEELNVLLEKNNITLPEAAIRALEFTAEEAELSGPTVVLGVSGPYYPHISNSLINNGTKYDLENRVNKISKERFGVEFSSKSYFMGISDLSYASLAINDADVVAIKENSPGWDFLYRIPFKAIAELEAPVVNIGPWGKDLHKPTERVYIKDVYESIPEICYELMRQIYELESE